jgi:biotin carboxyl carrier protein
MERKFKITVNDRQYLVTVEEITEGGSLVFPEPGSMHIPESAPPTPPPPSTVPAAGPGDEVSPLAGVIQSVLVSVGQAVHEGDKLATLEAMKMVTTVVAHHSGKVKHIGVKPGDAVEAGQILLTIG